MSSSLRRIIMNWRRGVFVLWVLLPLAHAWSATTNNAAAANAAKRNEVSPYLDLVLCPIREQPWSCARQQSARILDVWDTELHQQWQKLKVEADRQLNATIERRGYSATEVLTKEKPSTILKKIELGTGFMKEYLAETMDGFLGREYEYMQNTRLPNGATEDAADDDDDDDDEQEDDEGEEESDDYADNEQTEAESENAAETEDENNESAIESQGGNKNTVAASEDASNGVEFIEIENEAADGQLKGGGVGGGNKKKRKKGQKGQPATVLIVQQQAEEHGHGHEHAGGGHGHGGGGGGHGHGNKQKMKRKKRKKGQHGEGAVETIVVEEEPSNHLGLGLLEELVNSDDLLGGSGGKRKNKHPSKYGRSNGVTRGKKKKKKKALAKLVLLGSFLKAKIELLLKILGAHLQIKFFAIALIGLLINIARFWIDVKRGGAPQKVVYVEHAHHQHHYEEGGDDWGEQGGSYWKRSLQTDPTIEEGGASTDSYQPRPQPDAHYLAYRNQWQ